MTEQKTTAENIATAELKMQDWYDNEFTPYKQQKEAEKKNFENFAKVVVNNTAEVKYMLANIYENNSSKAVETWNALKLEPVIKDIKLKEDMLIITTDTNEELPTNFDELLANIEKVLGE
tara:strand:- start:4801 stop:5160 length:360 start_codon:yes stop_codon:yes gene_type:complete